MYWTKDEEKQLKELYPTTNSTEISKIFNRSPQAIIMKARLLGLKAINHRHRRTFLVNPFKNIEIEKISYFAGIIDGEGCISEYIHKKGKYNFKERRIIVCNTSKQLIDWLYSNFGGQITFKRKTKERYKEIWRWEIFNNNKVYHVLKLILPFLIVKKTLAEKIIKDVETL